MVYGVEAEGSRRREVYFKTWEDDAAYWLPGPYTATERWGPTCFSVPGDERLVEGLWADWSLLKRVFFNQVEVQVQLLDL
jgi:hypothetical protein